MSSCSALHTAAPSTKTLIKVNGVVIPRASISREAQNHPAPTPAAAWKAAALALVIREALSQEVNRLGIQAEPAVDAAGRRETDDEARMRALVDQETAVPEPTQEECRRYYERNRRRFRSSDLYEAAHILFAARQDDAASYDRARSEARTAIAELRLAPDLFADMARAHSACPSGKVGGNLGQIGTGQTTPAFEKALARMAPGAISEDPVETPYGIHVVRLDRWIEGRTLPFDLMRERVSAYLCDAVKHRSQAQYVARLLGGAQIEGIEIPSPGDFNVH